MYWANFFHIYQPPNWPARIVKKVATESYRPILKTLENNSQIKITLNISGSLTEQLKQHKLNDIISRIRKLAGKKQIELVSSALYHPILPLLPKSEIIRQIRLDNIINRKYLGPLYRPRGFFPPEMAYDNKVAVIAEEMGFEWIIIDEISGNNKLGQLKFNKAYSINNLRLYAVLRNRNISDYLSFRSKLNSNNSFWHEVDSDNRSQFALITAMDGENLGHHRQGLENYWEKLVAQKGITTLTISELLKKYPGKKTINPKKASWSSREIELKANNPYVLWQDPANPIHRLQWILINKIIRLVAKNKKHNNYNQARQLLDKRLASDQFWWASAKPWWSLSIIKEKTAELLEIVTQLKPDGNEYAELANEIIALAKQWQKQKKFITIKNRYLSSYKTIRYIGGKRISTKT